jgi:hypothetical protein
MSSQSKKQAVANVSNPLLHEGLLELALTFVGGGEALYMRAVNSSWKARAHELLHFISGSVCICNKSKASAGQ